MNISVDHLIPDFITNDITQSDNFQSNSTKLTSANHQHTSPNLSFTLGSTRSYELENISIHATLPRSIKFQAIFEFVSLKRKWLWQYRVCLFLESVYKKKKKIEENGS